ncbi:MAG TPA: hypothetical protein VKA70_12330 [Blastocatellia bacterium]|nr:hypothetical protein [Blastocatellia bacterium]
MQSVTRYNETEVTREAKIEQLERLLESRGLHGSESLKAFLRFVVLKSIENQQSDIKEYTIAIEVFGRSKSYDSRSDSVVRVQASRLRAKLQDYYANEGKLDPVIIDLPKGHYAPVFSYSSGADGATDSIDAPEAVAQELPAAGRARWWRWAVAAFAILVVGIGILALNYRSEARQPPAGSDSRRGRSAEISSAMPLWQDFLRSSEPVLVAFSNTLFEGTAETGMKIMKPMQSSQESGPQPAARPSGVSEADQTITEHYTGVGEVMGVYFLGDFFSKAEHQFRVKRSLLLNWDDLKTENIVILGSPAENFVLRELPQEQDFRFGPVKDENQRMTFGIINTKPKAGEQAVYLAKQEGPSRSQISEDYAIVSLLRGLDAEHRLMILAGITTFGTQAAAEYVTRPEYVKELIDKLNAASADAPRLPSYYQVLVKVKVNGGVPVQISYVTHHAL